MGYKNRSKMAAWPPEEHVAVPVVDSGIRVEWVDAARERKLYTNTIPKPHGQVPYYRCAAKKSDGNLACEGGNWGQARRGSRLALREGPAHAPPEVVMTAIDAPLEQEA